VSVSGASRYKYFRKPLVQNLYSFEPILTDPLKEDKIIGKKPLLDESLARTAACTQTLYRESETQTDPYSPPYFFHQRGLSSTVATSTDAKDPDILINNHLICSNGQLPGPKEGTCICRNNERGEKTKEVPSVFDEKILKLHKAFLEGQEQFEFKARERELDDILAMRLASFKENLYAKYAESERRAEEKLAVSHVSHVIDKQGHQDNFLFFSTFFFYQSRNFNIIGHLIHFFQKKGPDETADALLASRKTKLSVLLQREKIH
jgi:hypothetical protein